MKNLPKEFLEKCKTITAKRPRIVVDHILKHGYITTQDLKDKYGYNHPPRAARDVRENGIPLDTFKVTGSDGRKIAAYRFSKAKYTNLQKHQGRTGISKAIKQKLIEKYGCRCFIYLEEMDEQELQIDHRVPYEIGGDDNSADQNAGNFMLLCGSANRAKSWSCEHCKNRNKLMKIEICHKCYWAYPENYEHVAMR